VPPHVLVLQHLQAQAQYSSSVYSMCSGIVGIVHSGICGVMWCYIWYYIVLHVLVYSIIYSIMLRKRGVNVVLIYCSIYITYNLFLILNK
jgi:hypothetical protein